MMNDPFIFKADIKTIIPFRLIIAVQETLCEQAFKEEPSAFISAGRAHSDPELVPVSVCFGVLQ